MLKLLLENARNLNNKNIALIIKTHPREDIDDINDIKWIIKNYKLKTILNPNRDLVKLILISDIVISQFSTVLIESSYLDKPSISLQPGLKKEDFLITNKLGITVPVYKKEGIIKILKKVLYDKNYINKMAKKRKSFKIEGKSTDRVVNLVYKMLNIQ